MVVNVRLSIYFTELRLYGCCHPSYYILGSGALSGKMLLVRIVKNKKIDDYLGQVRLSKVQLCPARLEKMIRIGPRRVKAPVGSRNRNKHHLKSFSIILDPASNQKVHLIHILITLTLGKRKLELLGFVTTTNGQEFSF